MTSGGPSSSSSTSVTPPIQTSPSRTSTGMLSKRAPLQGPSIQRPLPGLEFRAVLAANQNTLTRVRNLPGCVIKRVLLMGARINECEIFLCAATQDHDGKRLQGSVRPSTCQREGLNPSRTNAIRIANGVHLNLIHDLLPLFGLFALAVRLRSSSIACKDRAKSMREAIAISLPDGRKADRDTS